MRQAQVPDSAVRKIAVLVDTSTGWGRRLIRGVINYAQKHSQWQLTVHPASRTEATALPPGWRGHGVIARVINPAMTRALRELAIPVVNVSGVVLKGADFPRVTTHYRAAAELAAEHFLERGFQHFGYVGPFNHAYVREHRDAFAAAVAERGHTCLMHDRRPAPTRRRPAPRTRRPSLEQFLTTAPRPIALFTWGTTTGIAILHACVDLGIGVPDEVAVLGGDDDRLLCEAATPPMSGVLVASEQIGYVAAQQLDGLMRGEPAPERTLIDPIDIATRQSTEVLAIQDRTLLEAVVYIRHNAYRPMSVAEVLRHVPMSRRSLERQFQQTFGRSPWQEIRRLRMARCRQLLSQSDAPMPHVAAACGFATPEHMTTIFKREHGVTPLKYRSRVRGR